MCTAATYKTKHFYFGRTLDCDQTYGEEVTIAPRNFPFRFLFQGEMKTHYAIIGMAHIQDRYPLYYDAMNEKGLCIAGLNFVGNAVYFPEKDGFVNLAQFELIPFLLGRCASVDEAESWLKRINLTPHTFKGFSLAELHWIIADKSGAITVESVADGLRVYENPVGVLTNNPPFDKQMFALNNYMKLSPRQPENLFSSKLELNAYSRGMGALGLPGDLSSASRFARVAFTKLNSISSSSEEDSVGQFFHILGSVDQQRGCCEVSEGKYEITIYTSCCNASRGIYYYTTYTNHQIAAVDMHREDLEGSRLICYPMLDKEEFRQQN